MTPKPGDSPEFRLDLDRTARIDLPEAIYCASKTVEQCVAIVTDLLASSDPGDAIVATRASAEQAAALALLEPTTQSDSTLTWRHRPSSGAVVAIVSAGTSDIPVAAECESTLLALGHQVHTYSDVGVAGLDRLINVLPSLTVATAVVAVAGMEGSLPTVLAGLIPQAIVAVPTSAGYGTSFGGATALLSMMSSCAPGLSVVGIDNGYGAACAMHRIISTHTKTP